MQNKIFRFSNYEPSEAELAWSPTLRRRSEAEAEYNFLAGKIMRVSSEII